VTRELRRSKYVTDPSEEGRVETRKGSVGEGRGEARSPFEGDHHGRDKGGFDERGVDSASGTYGVLDVASECRP
jgi:hypothetical protein